MIQPAKRYDKANSILGVRSNGRDREDALTRIRHLRETVQGAADGGATQDRAALILRACEDLLGPGDEAPDPRSAERPRFTLRDHVVEEIRRVPAADLGRYLLYRYRYEIYPQTKELDAFPPCLQIEPASVCNYRCVFCFQTDRQFTGPGNGHMGLMDPGLFREVVDQAEGACEAVNIASRGEPLICPSIETMLAYLKGKFLAVKLNTNAWFLDESKARAILDAGVNTLVFSVDAAREPLYSQLRVNGKLDRVLGNIRRFKELREREYASLPMITRVSGVHVSDEQDLDEMEAFWGGLVDQVVFVDYNPWENSYERPYSEVSAPCSDLWRRMFVWWDGTVNPCDVDYRSTLAVGSATETSLSHLWRGERYAGYRRAHLAAQRNVLSPCARCTVV